MYHDQGQIALKLKGFDEGITIAGGLPAPIVTCGHGTAYDIAGKGIARTSAMENAVKMTCRLASNSNHLYEEKMRQS
jgi:4-hydroxythreonine-4-phosphate dehydrogenase